MERKKCWYMTISENYLAWNQLALCGESSDWNNQTFPSTSVDSDILCLCCLLVGREPLLRSFPPGLADALPYHIIPTTAIIIPMTTCVLRPSFPKKIKPMIKTRIVFIWPITWKDTAVNLPMQMNWLRLVPTAIVHESAIKICKEQNKIVRRSNKRTGFYTIF